MNTTDYAPQVMVREMPGNNVDGNTLTDVADAMGDLPFTINLDYLQKFSAGDKAFEKDIMLSSIEEIDEKCNEMEGFMVAGDRENITRLAHSLKSICTIIGSIHLYNYYKIIETTGNDSSLENLNSLFADCQAVWMRYKMCLHTLLQNEYAEYEV